jgi:hypothetical protein
VTSYLPAHAAPSDARAGCLLVSAHIYLACTRYGMYLGWTSDEGLVSAPAVPVTGAAVTPL